MIPWPVSDLLPHAAPMILIDRMIGFDDESGVAEVTVRADHPFADKDGVPVHLGIEFMAQACGALTGCWAKQSGTAVRVGFLLGTRDFQANQAIVPLGVTLTIAVRLVIRDSEMGVFDCRLLEDDRLVAEARLNVYQPDSETAARATLGGGA
jgi:predicted hotdog family 3-hydroxylacyl-ACP dehydratase